MKIKTMAKNKIKQGLKAQNQVFLEKLNKYKTQDIESEVDRLKKEGV